MKQRFFLFAIFIAAIGQPVLAQSNRELAEARAVHQQANAGASGKALRVALKQQPAGYMGQGAFQFGALRTYDGRYRPVPGLRYHAGLRLLEAQDSVNNDSTQLWPAGGLRGFDLGEAGDAEMPLRRFRTRLIKEGAAGTRREFVEILTAIDAGPLVLAWMYSLGPEPNAKGVRPLVGTLVAGSGTNGAEPLRVLEADQPSVLRLFGGRADAVRKFVATERLDYTRPADIARMMDYYNRVAVIK